MADTSLGLSNDKKSLAVASWLFVATILSGQVTYSLSRGAMYPPSHIFFDHQHFILVCWTAFGAALPFGAYAVGFQRTNVRRIAVVGGIAGCIGNGISTLTHEDRWYIVFVSVLVMMRALASTWSALTFLQALSRNRCHSTPAFVAGVSGAYLTWSALMPLLGTAGFGWMTQIQIPATDWAILLRPVLAAAMAAAIPFSLQLREIASRDMQRRHAHIAPGTSIAGEIARTFWVTRSAGLAFLTSEFLIGWARIVSILD